MGGNLDSRISFSRGSNATVVGSNGLIKYAPHNLLTYSEQFDNAAWVKINATITTNASISPDGTTTAEKLVEGTISGTPYISESNVVNAGVPYTISVYAKESQQTPKRYVSLLFPSAQFGSNKRATFDLSAGTYVTTNSPDSASITPIGNGWYRCQVSATCVTSGTTNTQIRIATTYPDTLTPYTGDGTSGIYIWGAQINEGALQPYYPTTVKNLLGYSQNFGNAAWTKSNSSIAASTVIGPFGFDGGEKLVENTATSQHSIANSGTITANSTITGSCYIKAGERTTGWVQINNSGYTSGFRAQFNTSSGLATSATFGTGSVSNITMTPIGNGWYRVAATGIIDSSSTSGILSIFLNNGASYTGDGTSGIYIFGAQLSDSASLDPYSYNPVAAPTSTAYYGPRFDYDPATLAPKGLLIEEQRTNLLTYSSEFDNATWNKNASIVITANANTAPDGTMTADEFSGSLVNCGVWRVSTTTASIPHIYSIYLKNVNNATNLLVGCDANPANAFIRFNSVTGEITSVAGNVTSSSVIAIGNGWYRVTVGFVPTTTLPTFVLYSTSGASATWLVWGAQLEAGAFSTSYIPTTSATVTRAADNASMVGSNFSSWYNQSAGTVYCASDSPLTTTTAQMNWYINDGNTNNTMFNRKNLSNLNATAVVSGGVTQGDITSFSAITAYSTVKSAFAYKLNDLAISVNGASVGTDLAATIPTVDRIHLGQNISNGQILNGHIQSIKYYPTRLPNADLQRLTR
jgi:hypothetical protein